ncbi:Serine/threonine protein kinase [Minicystis rosea]|nr:Serine/threonine protein kinase [Minicystis rosea]
MRPGDVIAQRYRLDRHLGSGGMGAVWAATHTVTGRPIALKLIRAREDDPSARRRVLREARAAGAVQHPSVVAIHDVVETADGAPVLVMELLEGESLRARLDRDRTLSVAETRALARTVLGALDVAHRAGIVHRDLKPDNLFLLPSGEVKILDFGIAKLLAGGERPDAASKLTATGALVGTPFYMAPEQAFGEAVDGRADLWSLGVVLYECLAGDVPTRGDNLGQVLRRLTIGDLAPLSTRAPHVPAALSRAVDALLSIDVEKRPASAQEALDAIDASDDASLPKEPPAPTSKPPPQVAATLATTPADGRSSEPPSAEMFRGRATVPPRSLSRLLGIGGAVLVLAAGASVVVFVGVPSPSTPAPIPQEPAVVATSAEPAVSASAPVASVDPAPSAVPSASARPPAPRRAPATPSAKAVVPAPSAAADVPGTAPKLLTTVPF